MTESTIAKRIGKIMLFGLALLAIASIACTKKKEKVPLQHRPIAVTVLKIQSNRLRRQAHLTGSVLPWKQETLRFQVSGKLAHLRVVTPGKQVRGVLKDEYGKILYKGEVIAMLDATPYKLAEEQSEAQLEMGKIKLEATSLAREVAAKTIKAAQARVDAAQKEIDELFKLNEEIAQDQYKLAETIYKNTEEAYKNEDASHIKRAEARTNYLVANVEIKKLQVMKELKVKELETHKAELFQAQAEKKLREAEEKTAEAGVKSARAALKQARQNVEKCTLRAAFDGVISEIFVNPGTIIDPSVPIASLVMMDPVRVDMAVSFQKLRDFHFGNEVRVYPPQKSRYEKGYVYHIHTTADPSTRTFLAIIAVRNRKFDLDSDFFIKNKQLKKCYAIKNFSGVVHKNPDGSGPLYVDVRCIQRDEMGTFVWKVAEEPGYHFNPKATIQKVYVELGGEYVNVITWLFRELKQSNSLKDDDILLIRPSLLRADNIKDPSGMIIKLKNGRDFVSAYLWQRFSLYGRQMLSQYDENSPLDNTLQQILVDELNQVLQGELIYDQQRFMEITLAPELLDLVKYSPQGENLVYLNRLLIEHVYTDEIVKSHTELQPNQTVVQLRQDWIFHPGELVEVEYDRELPDDTYLCTEAILKARHTKEKIYYVFVIKDISVKDGYETGYAEIRKISKRKAEDLWAIKGVKPGEKVVIHGAYTVNNRYEATKDRIPVRIIKEEENLSDLIKGYTIISTIK